MALPSPQLESQPLRVYTPKSGPSSSLQLGPSWSASTDLLVQILPGLGMCWVALPPVSICTGSSSSPTLGSPPIPSKLPQWLGPLAAPVVPQTWRLCLLCSKTGIYCPLCAHTKIGYHVQGQEVTQHGWALSPRESALLKTNKYCWGLEPTQSTNPSSIFYFLFLSL